MEKGIVQTPNPKGAMKVVGVRITDWSLVQVQVPPPLDKKKNFDTSKFFLHKNLLNIIDE